jgi:hypothetical protein
VLGKDEEGEEWKRRPLIVASLGSMLSISEMFIRGIKDRSRWDAQEEGGQ